MKKVLFIAAAVAAMAACTKSEVVYDDNDTEIGLAPVNYMTTKTVYGPYEGTEYSDVEQFNVFAQYTSSNAGTQFSAAADLVPYLEDVTFEQKTGTGNSAKVWGGALMPYYWPKTGSLFFAGYSPAGATKEKASYSFEQGDARLTLKGFTQGQFVHDYDLTDNTKPEGYSMVDLMYFDVAPHSTSLDEGVGNATFRHALAWLTFKIKVKNNSADGLFQITKVSLKSIAEKGDFYSGTTSEGVTGWPSPYWNLSGQKKTENIVLYRDNHLLTHNKPLIIDNYLIIPQEIPGNGFVIEYKQRAGNDASIPMVVQTPAVKTLTGGNGTNDTDKWLINKHYVYEITFDPGNQILITPIIQEWESVPATSIDWTIQ